MTDAPPHSLEAEMCVLGSCILSSDAIQDVAGLLTHDDFYSPAHASVFRAIVAIEHGGSAVDIVTLRNYLSTTNDIEKVGGVEYLIQLAESVPSPKNAVHYGEIVRDHATRRRLIRAAGEMQRLALDPGDVGADEVAAMALTMVERATESQQVSAGRHVREGVMAKFTEIDDLYNHGIVKVGPATGFPTLDRMVTGGLEAGQLSILAARPAMGKTSFGLSLALNVSKEYGVLFLSLEMTEKQCVTRLLSAVSRIPMTDIRKAPMSGEDYEDLVTAAEHLRGRKLVIDDQSVVTPPMLGAKMRAAARMMAQEVRVIIIDYLTLMRPVQSMSSRHHEVGDTTKRLKQFAKDAGVHVMVLAQLNRQLTSRENKRPHMGDIRESGSIEEDADIILFVHRENYYKAQADKDFIPPPYETAELIVAKQRDGPEGIANVVFDRKCARFEPMRIREDD